MTRTGNVPANNHPVNAAPAFRRRVRALQTPISPAIHGKCYSKSLPAKLETYRPGYPRLAAFMNSDRTLCAFKQFGRLHARVLLYRQDELLELQDQLDILDGNESTSFFLHTRRQDQNTLRHDLLSKIGMKLNEYDILLRNYYRHLERKRPRRGQIHSVSNWLEGNKPLVPTESTAYQDWEDLGMPHDPSDHGGLENFLGHCAVILKKRGVPWVFSTICDRAKSSDNHVVYFSAERIAVASRVLTTFFAVTTLTVPIAVLYSITNMVSRLFAIALFTAIFSTVLCLTQTRNFEIFSASAAYCAVMVVFVANLDT